MKSFHRIRWSDDAGATLPEYALMIAFVAVVVVGAVRVFGSYAQSLFQLAVAAIDNAT